MLFHKYVMKACKVLHDANKYVIATKGVSLRRKIHGDVKPGASKVRYQLVMAKKSVESTS